MMHAKAIANGISCRPALLVIGLAPWPAVSARAQDEVGSASRPVRVGVTAGPHARVMERVREILARDGGPALRAVEFSDFNQPNAALAAGDLDANSFQHQPFLDQQARDRGLPIVSVARTLVFPMGVYSRRHRSLADVPDGGRVAVPNDPSNGGRALAVLAASGAFRLREGAGLRATAADIAENARGLRVVEMDAAQLPRALDEVEAAAINSNYAMLAGLNPVRDAIALERPDSPYANVIAVRRGDENAPWLRRLVAAYHTEEVRAFVRDAFGGAVVPAF